MSDEKERVYISAKRLVHLASNAGACSSADIQRLIAEIFRLRAKLRGMTQAVRIRARTGPAADEPHTLTSVVLSALHAQLPGRGIDAETVAGLIGSDKIDSVRTALSKLVARGKASRLGPGTYVAVRPETSNGI